MSGGKNGSKPRKTRGDGGSQAKRRAATRAASAAAAARAGADDGGSGSSSSGSGSDTGDDSKELSDDAAAKAAAEAATAAEAAAAAGAAAFAAAEGAAEAASAAAAAEGQAEAGEAHVSDDVAAFAAAEAAAAATAAAAKAGAAKAAAAAAAATAAASAAAAAAAAAADGVVFITTWQKKKLVIRRKAEDDGYVATVSGAAGDEKISRWDARLQLPPGGAAAREVDVAKLGKEQAEAALWLASDRAVCAWARGVTLARKAGGTIILRRTLSGDHVVESKEYDPKTKKTETKEILRVPQSEREKTFGANKNAKLFPWSADEKAVKWFLKPKPKEPEKRETLHEIEDFTLFRTKDKNYVAVKGGDKVKAAKGVKVVTPVSKRLAVALNQIGEPSAGAKWSDLDRKDRAAKLLFSGPLDLASRRGGALVLRRLENGDFVVSDRTNNEKPLELERVRASKCRLRLRPWMEGVEEEDWPNDKTQATVPWFFDDSAVSWFKGYGRASPKGYCHKSAKGCCPRRKSYYGLFATFCLLALVSALVAPSAWAFGLARSGDNCVACSALIPACEENATCPPTPEADGVLCHTICSLADCVESHVISNANTSAAVAGLFASSIGVPLLFARVLRQSPVLIEGFFAEERHGRCFESVVQVLVALCALCVVISLIAVSFAERHTVEFVTASLAGAGAVPLAAILGEALQAARRGLVGIRLGNDRATLDTAPVTLSA